MRNGGQITLEKQVLHSFLFSQQKTAHVLMNPVVPTAFPAWKVTVSLWRLYDAALFDGCLSAGVEDWAQDLHWQRMRLMSCGIPAVWSRTASEVG